jgi:uncharacterized membrane protein YoaK (UPF0700 family)
MTTPSRSDPLPWVLVVLTVTTGLVDAVSVLGLGRVFTANMTGNIVFLGFAAAGVPGFSVARALVSLAGFGGGAVLGGRLGVAMASVARRRWLLTVAVVESGLLLVAAWLAIGYDLVAFTPVPTLYALIVLTAVAMGLRNATVRRLAVPDLTTTVLTLTLTGIAADSTLAGGHNPRGRVAPRRDAGDLRRVCHWGGARVLGRTHSASRCQRRVYLARHRRLRHASGI